MHSEYLNYVDGKLYRKSTGKECASKTPKGYIRFLLNGKFVYGHRIVWEMHHGAIPNELRLDHINGLRDDNRIENLRLVTPHQNSMNNGANNVYKRIDGYGYKVQIKKDGKSYSFGTYKHKELAELVAREAKEDLFGDYARVKQ